jgi:N-acyl homoserine lactone hydrolase
VNAEHAERLFMLQFGAEPSPKAISVRGAGESIIWCPVVGALVETRDGLVLLDAGFSRRFMEDEPARQAIYESAEQPWALAGEPLVTALAEIDVTISDLALAVVSHLHCDHGGGIGALAQAGVEVAIHRDELAFARERAGLDVGYYRPDYTSPAPRWRELEGDTVLAPGLTVLATPGHSPGHLSFRIDLRESGTWILAVDAADLGENLNDRVPPGWTADPEDSVRAETSLGRLLTEADSLGARLVPGHDQVFWNAVRHPAGGHR